MSQKNKIIIDLDHYLESSIPYNWAYLIICRETGFFFKVRLNSDSFKEIEGIMIPVSFTKEVNKIHNFVRQHPEVFESRFHTLEIIKEFLKFISIAGNKVSGVEIDMDKESEYSELIMPVKAYLTANENENGFDVLEIKGYILFNESVLHSEGC